MVVRTCVQSLTFNIAHILFNKLGEADPPRAEQLVRHGPHRAVPGQKLKQQLLACARAHAPAEALPEGRGVVALLVGRELCPACGVVAAQARQVVRLPQPLARGRAQGRVEKATPDGSGRLSGSEGGERGMPGPG